MTCLNFHVVWEKSFEAPVCADALHDVLWCVCSVCADLYCSQNGKWELSFPFNKWSLFVLHVTLNVITWLVIFYSPFSPFSLDFLFFLRAELWYGRYPVSLQGFFTMLLTFLVQPGIWEDTTSWHCLLKGRGFLCLKWQDIHAKTKNTRVQA